LPRLTLLAAVIVFRRHPEITMLVVLLSGLIGSALKRRHPLALLTSLAQWMLAGVLGAAVFQAVGFSSTARFVLATVALIAVWYVAGPVVEALCEAPKTEQLAGRFTRGWRLTLLLEGAGVVLALAWRTSALQPAALKVADGALIALTGIVLGTILQGRRVAAFAAPGRIPVRVALPWAALLVLGLFSPLPLAWMLPMALALVAAGWACWRRAYAVLCCAAGAFANELVRSVNAGLMPVEGSGLMSGLGAANTYTQAGPQTALAFLDDRLHLPPPFPGIASAGDVLIALGLVWLVATASMYRRHTAADSSVGERTQAVDPAA
jgi:hypothetical protein